MKGAKHHLSDVICHACSASLDPNPWRYPSYSGRACFCWSCCLARPSKPQTVLLRWRPTVGVENGSPASAGRRGVIPLEIRSYRIGRREGVPRSAAPRMGSFTSSSEVLGITPKRSGLRRTLVRPRRMRKERPLLGSTGRKSFLPNVMARLKRKHRRAVQGEWQLQLRA